MSNLQVIEHEGKKIEKVAEFLIFARWFGIPEAYREPRTHLELAEKLKVSVNTLTEWKRHPRFQAEMRAQAYAWAKEKIPDVMDILYNKIRKDGHNEDIKFFLEWIGEISKEGIPLWEGSQKDVITEGDTKTVSEKTLKIYKESNGTEVN